MDGVGVKGNVIDVKSDCSQVLVAENTLFRIKDYFKKKEYIELFFSQQPSPPPSSLLTHYKKQGQSFCEREQFKQEV